MALGLRNGVAAQRGSAGSERFYLFLTAADEHLAASSGLNDQDLDFAKKLVLGDETLLGRFGPRVKELVGVAFDEEARSQGGLGSKLDIRPVCELDIEKAWPPRERNMQAPDTQVRPLATLVGDAAHLMPPNGEGVNLGMLDAMLLVRAIADTYDESTVQNTNGILDFRRALIPRINAFEEDMAARARDVLGDTRKLMGALYGTDDGAKVLADMFRDMRENAKARRNT